jgi:hypothetical protein
MFSSINNKSSIGNRAFETLFLCSCLELFLWSNTIFHLFPVSLESQWWPPSEIKIIGLESSYSQRMPAKARGININEFKPINEQMAPSTCMKKESWTAFAIRLQPSVCSLV